MLMYAHSTLCSALSTTCRKCETITRPLQSLSKHGFLIIFMVALLCTYVASAATTKFEGLWRKAAANPTIVIRNKTDVVVATAKVTGDVIAEARDHQGSSQQIFRWFGKNEEGGVGVSTIGHHWIWSSFARSRGRVLMRDHTGRKELQRRDSTFF